MKFHRFDALSFVSGLVATVIGLIFLIPAEPADLFDYFGDIGVWFWPAVLVAVGVAILAPLVTGHREEQAGDGD
ncbi:MAG: hypothetical protein ACRDU9_00645 [Acidimicrobiia bacterium]